MEMHFAKLGAVLAVLAFAVPASANAITFETAPPGVGFAGPVTESGFSYKFLAGFGGGLLVDNLGNPGQDMEGAISFGGGFLQIKRADGGTFWFDQLDYAATDSTGVGDQTLLVAGGLHNTLVGLELYTSPNASTPNTWTTEAAVMLAGVTIDELIIPLAGGASPGLNFFFQGIDNVVLTPSGTIPEPATLALFGMGLLGFAVRRRRA